MSGQRDVPEGKGLFLNVSPKVSNIKTKKVSLELPVRKTVQEFVSVVQCGGEGGCHTVAEE